MPLMADILINTASAVKVSSVQLFNSYFMDFSFLRFRRFSLLTSFQAALKFGHLRTFLALTALTLVIVSMAAEPLLTIE
ncbi:hypothetical protein AHAS_Ahas13G0402400 [Arachis hypogaea]